MNTDLTAQPTPTLAPVAVPEGGWRDGDWVVVLDAFGRPFLFERGEAAWTGAYGFARSDEQMNRSSVIHVHAPREDDPARPVHAEPVTAPLPSEAVVAALDAAAGCTSSVGDAPNEMVWSCGYVARLVTGLVEADRRHTVSHVTAADERARDEGTVRVPRTTMARLANAFNDAGGYQKVPAALGQAISDVTAPLDGFR